MSYQEFLRLSGCGQIILCTVALCLLAFRGRWRQYWALGAFLAVRVGGDTLLWLFKQQAYSGAPRALVYMRYFYTYWITFAIESVLALVILYSIFRLTLEPLRGLQRYGSRLLACITVLCVALPLFSSLFSPFGAHINGTKYMMATISQVQQVQCVLTLCLGLIVFGVARALGLPLRSTVIGVTTGLAILAASSLVFSRMLLVDPVRRWHPEIANMLGAATALMLWAIYLAFPERASRAIHLPPDSLLARWNRVCLTWAERA